MKKSYIIPEIKESEIKACDFLAASGSVTGDGDGRTTPNTGYGGIDTEGGKDPDAREYTFSVWDEE
ncbi:MAG: hypothetical protein J6Z41_09365 [Prevotella sp.]|nr:hypothetical protein [Prevotella sp.]